MVRQRIQIILAQLMLHSVGWSMHAIERELSFVGQIPLPQPVPAKNVHPQTAPRQLEHPVMAPQKPGAFQLLRQVQNMTWSAL